MRYAAHHFPTPAVRTRTAGDFSLTETRYGAEALLPTHTHEFACIVVALRGSFHERYDGKTREVSAGTVILRPAGEAHSDRFDRAGGSCLNVELAPRWVEGIRELSSRLDRPGALTSGRFATLGRRLHAELVHGDELSAIAVESLVLSLIAESSRDDQRRGAAPRWLMHVKQRIDDDPCERISLGTLAAAAGVHAVHLSASFRRHFGTTIASYIRQSRIELACRLLATSDAPIADVALAGGFADQSHFGRAFKSALGTTPAAWRAASRGIPKS